MSRITDKPHYYKMGTYVALPEELIKIPAMPGYNSPTQYAYTIYDNSNFAFSMNNLNCMIGYLLSRIEELEQKIDQLKQHTETISES